MHVLCGLAFSLTKEEKLSQKKTQRGILPCDEKNTSDLFRVTHQTMDDSEYETSARTKPLTGNCLAQTAQTSNFFHTFSVFFKNAFGMRRDLEYST